MLDRAEIPTAAIQGGPNSYHEYAALHIADHRRIETRSFDLFKEVVKNTRVGNTDLGVIAVRTVVGSVEESIEELLIEAPDALSPIVARVDIPVQLVLIGPRLGRGRRKTTLEDIQELGNKAWCLGQRPALAQSQGFLKANLPAIKYKPRKESTRAIDEVVRARDRRKVAIGPHFAAKPLNGVVIGPDQINPPDSVTSFYVLQQDPRRKLLPVDPLKTAPHTVVSLTHPLEDGAFERCMEAADRADIRIARFLPYDYQKKEPNSQQGGGILELSHDIFDPQLTEFFARVYKLRSSDGERRKFETHELGRYMWYPEEVLSPQEIVGMEPPIAHKQEDAA